MGTLVQGKCGATKNIDSLLTRRRSGLATPSAYHDATGERETFGVENKWNSIL